MRKSVPRVPSRQAEMAFGNAAPELGKRELVLRELNRILESSFFRKAARSTQFLRYVVEYEHRPMLWFGRYGILWFREVLGRRRVDFGGAREGQPERKARAHYQRPRSEERRVGE